MPNVLTSWKEIAQYLGKGVRTVQRWEQMFGLPVRRPTAGNHHAIVAIPEELDAWLRSARSRPQSELDALRREVETLRAENALLKRRLLPRGSGQSASNGFHQDADLMARTSQLIVETTQISQRTRQVLARSRTLLSAREAAASIDDDTRSNPANGGL